MGQSSGISEMKTLMRVGGELVSGTGAVVESVMEVPSKKGEATTKGRVPGRCATGKWAVKLQRLQVR